MPYTSEREVSVADGFGAVTEGIGVDSYVCLTFSY